MLKIELTEEQKILLKSYFEAIYHANQIGVGAAIAGQVWEDGLVVKLVSGESGRTLSAALGGSGRLLTVQPKAGLVSRITL